MATDDQAPPVQKGAVPTGLEDLNSDAQRLIAHTYYGLRWGLAILAFIFPFVLWFGFSLLTSGLAHPTSISAFYHTPLRNYFVATVVALGLFLILYKGFSKAENLWLNLAGCAALVVAFFPTDRDRGSTDAENTWVSPHVLGMQIHGVAALTTFGSMGLVAVLFGKNTLAKLPKDAKATFFNDRITVPLSQTVLRKTYQGIGAAMIIVTIVCLPLSKLDEYWFFGFEALALLVFVSYWLVKTAEFRASGAENKAIIGENFPSPSTSSAIRNIRVIPIVEPRQEDSEVDKTRTASKD